MTRSQTGPDFADRPPWTRPGFIAAGALLAMVVIAGVVVALLPSPGARPNAGPTGTGAPTTPATGGGTAPAPTDLPTDIPTVAPAGVSWQLVGLEAVPTSASAGPYRVSGGTASGYAHTPTGALVAIAQLAVRAAPESGQGSWEPTITQQFLPGADRDKLLAAIRAEGPVQADPGERLPQVSGFRYISYTPDTAVVGLVVGPTNTKYTITTLTVVWRDGDWRMVAPPGATWATLTQPLTDLSNVVPWGPQ
jgi:hypothetical protein